MNKILCKKSLCIFLAVAAVILQLSGISYAANAASGTSYTWNNTIPQKSPSGGSGNGKLVLFDNSHCQTAGAADWVIDGGFSDFADDLVQEGYTVREYRGIDKNGDGAIRYYDDRQPQNVSINEAVITYDGIKDADVFVIAEANRPFTISEYAALKQFVDSGKGIYFISDHYNADRNMNTWDSTEVYNGYNRSSGSSYNMGGEYGDMRNPGSAYSGWLSQNFGLRFRFNAINCKSGVSDVRPSQEAEGITAGVGPILMAAGSTLAITDINKAKGIVYFSSSDSASKWNSAVDSGLYFGGRAEGPYVAISKPSAGKAAFIGDSSPIEDATPKYKRESNGSSKSTYPGWTDPYNASLLSVNIVNWLATPESYVGFDGINHTKGIATPTPMADIEKNTPQAEPWAAPGYDPWNTDTFAYGSYGAPDGPNSTQPPPSTGEGLIISQYIEGSGNNKAIELYNGTQSSVNLSEYSLVQYNNGSSSVTYTLSLSGTLASGAKYVIVNSSASSTLLSKANLTTSSSVMTFNGNDVIALRRNGSNIDIIGQIGYNPGTEWGSGLTSTCDNTLVRKSTVTSGDANGADAFDPSLQWDGYERDTFTYLGSR
ncbi:lamin tail-like protein [Anaerobacterium chartisolvens]|uniref:Lamin tail-like protein n=1 Tax=Anaerobacterium chartisolvens TaxID=1297424 RepID=A0A369AVD5_9FIRM|nr:lamin tail domain-containing protein [Anaerobacterium chartisolvens]RCX12196.1 lamin tail-like protein [Anaerobacterium chartisolvens]